MSFEEKSNLLMLTAVIVVYGWYTVAIVAATADTPITEIAYQPLMIVVVIPLVAIAIIGHAVIAALKPSEAGQHDERDRVINMRAERIGGYVVGSATFTALVVTMLDLDNFWIAQVLLAGLVLSEIVEGTWRAVLYRRGVA